MNVPRPDIDSPNSGVSRRLPVSEQLNRECFCITLDREALCRAMVREVGDAEFCATYLEDRPNLFSHTPVFLARDHLATMLGVVRMIDAAVRLPGYREAALSWAPEIARRDLGPRGAFMGYDFHLGASGPKLIEINTNAGGAFLNAVLARAQRACCEDVATAMRGHAASDFETAVVEMFRREFALQRGSRPLRTIAIVDDHPRTQFLYPEFLLAQRLLQRNGIETRVVDAAELHYEKGALRSGERAIDLVYNRLVDFALAQDDHAALARAYRDGAVVVTPNPHVHALLADKRNLALLSDRDTLAAWGLPPALQAAAEAIPATQIITPENSAALWSSRKQLFFKPATGYGSKAVYRGDKATRGTWSEIVKGGYVAQEYAPPGERVVQWDGQRELRKVDVRLYVYDGQLVLAAARLYQGQATNFRTPGGGFAPVYAV